MGRGQVGAQRRPGERDREQEQRHDGHPVAAERASRAEEGGQPDQRQDRGRDAKHREVEDLGADQDRADHGERDRAPGDRDDDGLRRRLRLGDGEAAAAEPAADRLQAEAGQDEDRERGDEADRHPDHREGAPPLAAVLFSGFGFGFTLKPVFETGNWPPRHRRPEPRRRGGQGPESAP